MTRADLYKTEHAVLQVRGRTRSAVPMAAHVVPMCKCGVKPVRFSETIMEMLLHEARNGTDLQYENPHRTTLLLLLCLVLLLAVWNHNEKKCSIPGTKNLQWFPSHNEK